MTYLLSGALALLSLSSTSTVQANVNPQDLRASLYCLAHSRFEFLQPSNEVIRLHVFNDITSRPLEWHVFVFVVRGRGVYDGYDVRIHKIAGMTRYEIVNNARLVDKGDAIEFISPQLGGIWEQNQFKRDFRAALAHKGALLRLPKLHPRGVVCTSYTDQSDFGKQ